MSPTATRVALPCSTCNNVAAEITPPELDPISKFAIVKLAKSRGAEVDSDSPLWGFTPASIADFFALHCAACVTAKKEI